MQLQLQGSYRRRAWSYEYDASYSANQHCPEIFSRHSFRFMDAYRQPGLEGPLADYAMKLYSSHRKIPANILGELQADFDEGKPPKSYVKIRFLYVYYMYLYVYFNKNVKM